jgi:hypothetical protein
MSRAAAVFLGPGATATGDDYSGPAPDLTAGLDTLRNRP